MLRLLLLSAATVGASAARQTAPFDEGWRFHLGDIKGGEALCSDKAKEDAFEKFDGMSCSTFAHAGAYSLTEAECRRYCWSVSPLLPLLLLFLSPLLLLTPFPQR